MATHTVHDDVATAGLADGCSRCEEQAKDPFGTLDETNLRVLAQRVIDGERPRSDNEGAAMYVVRRAIQDARTLLSLGVGL